MCSQGPSADLKAALERVTVKEVLDSKNARGTRRAPIALEHNSTVAQALKVMGSHRILSAPMVISPDLEDMEEGGLVGGGGLDQTDQSLLGWVDISDILRSLLSHLHAKKGGGPLPLQMLALMADLEAEAPHFINKSLISLAGGEDKSLVYKGEVGSSLSKTISEFFLNNAGIKGKVVHRLALFDGHGQIECIVSQLDIIKYLANHPLLLGDSANAAIKDLSLLTGRGQVLCVDPHTPTLLAMEKLVAAKVSGAAVLSADGSGSLIANISVSDLRSIQPDQLGVLALPVAEFLALLHGTSYLGYSQRSSTQVDHPFFASGPRSALPPMGSSRSGSMDGYATVPPDAKEGAARDTVRALSCHPSTSLEEMLKLLSYNHVHRVYVVDPEAKPQVTAVITPTDILQWLVS